VGGRNLLVATIVAVVLLGFIIASLIWVPWVFVGFAAIFVTIGVVELNNALLDSTAKPIGWIVTVFTPIILVATYLAGDHLTWASPLPVTVSPFSVVIGAAAVVMLLCCVWRLLGPTTGYVNDVSTAIFVLVYLPVLGSSIVLLMLGAHPVAGVLMCLVCPIANDTGAYALGVATASTVGGNHKMAPRISPAKSWEGFVGGLVVGTAAGAVFSHFALDYSWLLGAICGLLLSLVAVFGDLIESIMKRDAGLKDFGHIIPGHGGAMDRLDSIIFVAPVFYLFTGVVG
jgi:phosphatidate cytidylyltransferase